MPLKDAQRERERVHRVVRAHRVKRYDILHGDSIADPSLVASCASSTQIEEQRLGLFRPGDEPDSIHDSLSCAGDQPRYTH